MSDSSGTFKVSMRIKRSLRAPRILIVDDDLATASELKRKLRDGNFPLGKMHCEIDVVEDIATARQYLIEDDVDIYLVDLQIWERANKGPKDPAIGRNFVREVVTKSNAGVIVCSALNAETEAAPMLHEGADYYLEKYQNAETFSACVLAVWRRIQQSRPKSRNTFAHTNRAFLIGQWQFRVGDRLLQNADTKEQLRLSPTEHAFLRHICTLDDHILDIETFNLEVLGRPLHERFKRIDNFIYRLRNKLGDSVQFLSHRDGAYKLLDLRELKPGMA
jgi:DNA-binding response OmpR family regulator